MGNQRRFAALASDPPRSETVIGKNSNNPTLSPRTPAMPGVQPLALDPQITKYSVILSAGLASHSQKLHSKKPHTAGLHVRQGTMHGTVPSFGRQGRWPLQPGLGCECPIETLSPDKIEQSWSAAAHSLARTPLRVNLSDPSDSAGRSGRPAEATSAIIRLTVRIARSCCKRVRGRAVFEHNSKLTQTEEE